MAIIRGSIAGSISGSMGSITFSHNKGGAYIRNRSIPVNPNTPYQQAVRAHCATLANLWNGTLTDVQRLAWATYASNVPVTNALGDTVYLSGLNHYIRSNVPRLIAGLTRIDDAPVTFNIGSFTNPSFAVSATNDEVAVSFTNTDEWAGAAGGAMLVFAGRQQALTINFFKGPYRYAGKIAGAATPPTSPATIDLPFALDTGNRMFLRVICTTADGRLSIPFRDYDDA
jgi:hypothetical protein